MIHAISTPAAWEKGATFALSAVVLVGGGVAGLISLLASLGRIVDKDDGLITVFKQNSTWQKKVLAVISAVGFLISAAAFLNASFILLTHAVPLGTEALSLAVNSVIIALYVTGFAGIAFFFISLDRRIKTAYLLDCQLNTQV